MKRYYLAGLVLIAVAAGYLGGQLGQRTEPQPV
jgi:hypothetical protein